MDLVVGSKIKFTEGIFGGSWKRPHYLGSRTIIGTILKESYGAKRGQHTFSIEVHSADGYDAEEVIQRGKIRRKGRNVYDDCELLELPDDFEALADEKHQRAAAAKEAKYQRWIDEGKYDKVPTAYLEGVRI
tara:strand:+ start:225 stop:620 length:396 start_codon:yes stop_codon:yes gene_type:complete